MMEGCCVGARGRRRLVGENLSQISIFDCLLSQFSINRLNINTTKGYNFDIGFPVPSSTTLLFPSFNFNA
jgi:hypothetical protein